MYSEEINYNYSKKSGGGIKLKWNNSNDYNAINNQFPKITYPVRFIWEVACACVNTRTLQKIFLGGNIICLYYFFLTFSLSHWENWRSVILFSVIVLFSNNFGIFFLFFFIAQFCKEWLTEWGDILYACVYGDDFFKECVNSQFSQHFVLIR